MSDTTCRQMRYMAAPVLGPALLLLLLFGCGVRSPQQSLVTLQNRHALDADWRAACATAESQFADDSRYHEALWAVVMDPYQPRERKQYALGTLLKRNGAFLRERMGESLPAVPDLPTLELLLGAAVEQQWRELSADLLRSLARGSTVLNNEDRPERDAIVSLNPGRTVDQVALSVFLDVEQRFSIVQQTAAWVELARTRSNVELAVLLGEYDPHHRLALELRRSWADWRTLPRTREEVIWMKALMQPMHGSFSGKATAIARKLSAEQACGLRLRHLAVLTLLDERRLALSVDAMREQVRRRVGMGEHHHRAVRSDGGPSPWRQIDDWADRLKWGDLVAMSLLMEGLSRPDVQADLFTQAGADLADDRSEHGGLIVATLEGEGLAFRAEPFEPMKRVSNSMFYAPPHMIFDLHTALAYYHFHARNADEGSRFAGPGIGDLVQARGLGASFIVLTLVSPDALNVDYYQPDGVVVDLMTLRHGN